jgi:hypothetical protein
LHGSAQLIVCDALPARIAFSFHLEACGILSALKLLLRIFSYLFHGLLTLFLLAISGLALSSGAGSLNLKMLPWTGDTLAFVLFFGALFGLLSLILALGGRMRLLFFLWALIVVVLMVKGYVFSGYFFAPEELKITGWILGGALLALIGAWPPKKRAAY